MDSPQPHAIAGAPTAPSRAVKASYDAGAMILLVLSAVILLGVFALVVTTDNESRRISDQLRTSRSVESGVYEIAMLLQTLQSSRRGFAVTKDPAMRARFDAALERIPVKERALRELVADHPERRRAFEAFSRSLAAYLPVVTGFITADAGVGFQRAALEETFRSPVPAAHAARTARRLLLVGRGRLSAARDRVEASAGYMPEARADRQARRAAPGALHHARPEVRGWV